MGCLTRQCGVYAHILHKCCHGAASSGRNVRGRYQPVVVEEVLYLEAETFEAGINQYVGCTRTLSTNAAMVLDLEAATCETSINRWWVVTVFQAAVVAIPTAQSIAVLPSVVVRIFVVPLGRGLLAAGLRGHRSHQSFLSFGWRGREYRVARRGAVGWRSPA